MRTYTRRRPDHQLIENVHELCRLCLCKTDGVVPIFTEETDNVCAVLALRIMICVGLEIKKEDCLPNTICTDCLNNLNKCYAFRKKCEVSYQKLKSHVLAVKETEYKKQIQKQNENKNKERAPSEDEMKFVVTFEKNQLPEVSMLHCNGNSNVANLKNNLSNTTNADRNIENTITLQASEELVQETEIQEPDITTFLTAVLLQLGMLTQQDNELVLTEQTIKSLDVETGDGSQVVFELMEEDEQVEVLEESIVTEQPLEPAEESNSSEQTDIAVKYATSNAVTNTKPAAQNKKAKAENKKTGAWCDECGKQLATRSALHRHRRVHSGEKPFACQHCGRTFGQKEVMMRHVLVHEERRPHACSVCSKSFTQRAALAAHARAHAPPHARPLAIHRCSRCPKVFLYASGLSRHMMMHAGRVYVCGACHRHFRDKSSLLRHFKNANHEPQDT